MTHFAVPAEGGACGTLDRRRTFTVRGTPKGQRVKPVMLVVDDEALLRMELVELAQEAGFETVEAVNAAHAQRVLESRQDIKVVFTDIRMPGEMDGVQLAHVIRDRWPPTVVVICSGNAEPAKEELPHDVAFLSKPCHAPKTTALLAEIFDRLDGENSRHPQN